MLLYVYFPFLSIRIGNTYAKLHIVSIPSTAQIIISAPATPILSTRKTKQGGFYLVSLFHKTSVHYHVTWAHSLYTNCSIFRGLL